MSQIKERPILFSAPMVRAILEGRKTVTRRMMKVQFPAQAVEALNYAGHRDAWAPCNPLKSNEPMKEFACWCPYGKPGDRLWVRETIECDEYASDSAVLSKYAADGEPVLYTDCEDPAYNGTVAHWDYPRRVRPSIHMPRWASRILLEITDVRVERLKDISEEQAQAEGCFFTDYGKQCFHGGTGWKDVGDCPAVAGHPQREGWMWDKTTSHEQCLGSARHAFGNLWNKVNGPDAWDSNPWVWVVEFKQVKP